MAGSGFRVVSSPRTRRIMRDSGWLARNRYLVSALISVDVTDARQLIHDYRQRTGQHLSLTAYVTYCVGRAVAADRMIHAMRGWSNRLIVFNDVDILVTIEIEEGGDRLPVVYPIRTVDGLEPAEIESEIRRARETFERQGATVLWRRIRLFALLPAFIRHAVYRVIYRSPRLVKKHAGTVELTAVGMFGRGGGWGIAKPNHTLGVLIGGREERPWVKDGAVAVRDILDITIQVDHDIVDGAPAARFSSRLKQMIESGEGLP